MKTWISRLNADCPFYFFRSHSCAILSIAVFREFWKAGLVALLPGRKHVTRDSLQPKIPSTIFQPRTHDFRVEKLYRQASNFTNNSLSRCSTFKSRAPCCPVTIDGETKSALVYTLDRMTEQASWIVYGSRLQFLSRKLYLFAKVCRRGRSRVSASIFKNVPLKDWQDQRPEFKKKKTSNNLDRRKARE